MLKIKEKNSPDSCWNKAKDDEIVFVLLDRDPVAPAVIRYWIRERIRAGLNGPNDSKLLEASKCANKMELKHL